MGLLIAFTFTGAATRFDARRSLVTQQVNAIGTAWLHLFGFAAIMALSVYIILDIEYPRLGLIRIDSFDQAIIELRQSMN